MKYKISTAALLLTSGFTSLASFSAMPPARAADAPPPDYEEIVVTGSRAPAKSELQTLAPVEVVTGAELARTGGAGLLQQLSTLVPSFNLPAIAGQDASSAVRYGQLRGLSPDETLVLVNGKRRHASAIVNVGGNLGPGSVPVDLDFIPDSAIDHVEILRDGAAAQYGSDAIAGVVNIILKSDHDGGAVSGLIGQYARDQGLTFQTGGHTGYSFGDGGSLTVFGELRREDPIDRSSGDPAHDFAHTEINHARGEERIYQFGFNGVLPVNDAVTAYAFGTYGRRNTLAYQNFRQPDDADNVLAIYPGGFEPRLAVEEDDFSITAGLRGAVAAWNWDLSTTYGRDIARFGVENSVNPTFGSLSPTKFDNGDEAFGQWTTTLDISRPVEFLGRPLNIAFGAEFRRETYDIDAGTAPSYTDGGMGGYTLGSVSFIGFTPADVVSADRNVEAFYTDFESEITDKWKFGLAGRLEHYDDFGTTLAGKASTRYQLLDGLAVRATVSNGYRAPALGQSFFSSTSSNQFFDSTANLVYLRPGSAAAQALGAGKLTPEKSINTSLGVVIEPVRDLTLTVDAYRIDIKNRILLSSQIYDAFNPGVADLLAALGYPGANAFQYFTNAADTRTNGVDVVATYRIDGGPAGQFKLSANFDYNRTQIRRLVANPAQLDALGALLFDRNRIGQVVDGNPKNKLILGVDWSLDAWTVNFRETRYGQTFERDFSGDGPNFGDSIVQPKWITDIDIAYAVNDSWTLAVGAKNLFDVTPGKRPPNSPFISSAGGEDYPGTSPYGLGGAFWYVRTSLAF